MTIAHAAGIWQAAGGAACAAASVVSGASLANFFGRIGAGAAADASPRGAKRVLVGASTVSALACATLAAGPGGLAGVALAVVGCCYGATMTCLPAMTSRLFPERFSDVYGRVFATWGAAGVLAPLMAGALFDRMGNYAISCGIAAAIAFTSASISATLPGSRLE